MKIQIIDKLGLIATDKTIGSSFINMLVIYEIKLQENCRFYLMECNEDGELDERGLITLIGLKDNFKFKMKLTNEFLELCEIDMIKTCILSEFKYHYERVRINS